MSEKRESRFAEKIREYLSSTGKKISDLAKETGIPYTSLVSYINEGRQPTFSVVERLIDKANISPEWLFLDEGKMLLSEEFKDRDARYFLKFLFEQYGLDPMEDSKQIEMILKHLRDVDLREWIAKFVKVFDAETDVNTAVKLIDELINFLLNARSVLAMRYTNT